MLTESMEDYLETIYRLAVEKGYVRAVDVAESLCIQASSVTRMIKKLHACGLLRYEKYRHIALTPSGASYGQFLSWRDRTLKQFLRLLSAEAALEDQIEGIEHYVTPATMSLFRDLIAYFEAHPQALIEVQGFRQRAYPDGEELVELRAWSARHSMED